MPNDISEKRFEDAIEDHLRSAGYDKGDKADFDAERAIEPERFVEFVQTTQKAKWDAIQALHGANTREVVLDELCKAMDARGSLDVLRHGFKVSGKLVDAAYFKPAHGLNPDGMKLYAQNKLTVTRQVHFSPKDTAKSIDLLISLNGLPIITAELKNQFTGQNVNHSIHQYKNNRDPRDLLFQFKKRALVHFAIDTDLAFMTTKLAGNETFFLPFNLGYNHGAGNPQRIGKHRTWYVWEQVWQRDSLLDIFGRFLHLEVKERVVGGKTVRKETMVFPRFHQLDCVRLLEHDAKQNGPGKNYLIQHSAGSGKSNSIAWLVYRLAFLHDDKDKRIFDSVVVITDRIVLDQQLQDTIYQFEHKRGVVQKIDEDTAQLATALRQGVPIIITTLQKFPFVTEQIRKQAEEEARAKGLPIPDANAMKLAGKQFAVIIDEAHSSQSGETATELKAVLAADHIKQKAKEEAAAKGLDDAEEEILKTMAKRGRQPNISFFAFTATPKHKTLKVFGVEGPDGQPVPFHLYSMRQAIEEGFIHDVLKYYTTYKTYFGLIKKSESDPKVERKAAAKALARFMSLHPANIAQKVEVIVEHFRAVTRHKIGGKAKAMVVTGSRLHAVRYKQAFDAYIREKTYTGIDTLVAFSGTVFEEHNKDITYTESSMNKGIGGREIPEKFGGEEYQILIAADKFQTGFDQPLLHTMYVDKRLAGIQAVQTLSRLNRTHAGKEDTFVLDFNHDNREEVLKAFQTYYEKAAIGDEADPQQMYVLQGQLDGAGVYHAEEVEAFSSVFFAPKHKQSLADHATMNSLINSAVDRFKVMKDDLRATMTDEAWKQLKTEAQEEFRGRLTAFRNLYAFLSQVIPYQDSQLEKLYTYARFLLKKLPRPEAGPRYDFDDDVTLKYFRLQKISEGSIAVESGKPGELKGPTAVGTGRTKEEEIELSQLIDVLNERFGTDFKPADQLFLDSVREQALADGDLKQAAEANTPANFGYVFKRALEGLFIDRMEENEDIFNRFMSDPDFRKVVEETLGQQVYEKMRTEVAMPNAGH